jgi:uridylate kinase
VLYGEHDGTDIIPEGTTDQMTYWVDNEAPDALGDGE